ncbi:MAG: hypothetical protein IJU81_04625 [Bacteroidales bacterium]|nr:hypothetical protein [Bacteroidales bacterium]
MRDRAILVATMTAAVLLAVSCQKDGDDKTFIATAEKFNADGKIEFADNALNWSSEDTISVYDAQKSNATYTLNKGEGTGNGEFTYHSGGMINNSPFSVVYPAKIHTEEKQINLPAVQHSTDGSLKQVPMYATITADKKNQKEFYIDFYHLCGVVCFRVSSSQSVSVSRIAVSTDKNTNGVSSITGSAHSPQLTTPKGTNVTTLACLNAPSVAQRHDFYMYLPCGTYNKFRILVTAADGSVYSTVKDSVKVERGKITSVNLSNITFKAHKFSTSATAKVVFSPGNLQYIGDCPDAYWKFADRHYDYIGATGKQNTSAINASRDLFGWGTSGWVGNGNLYYQPYHTSYKFDKNIGYGYGPTNGSSYTLDLTADYDKADWGYDSIVNGGNESGMWRTLSAANWDTLMNVRKASKIGNTANARYAKAKVNNINGIILFPDEYTQPSGATAPNYINDAQAVFGNNYTAKAWFLMEAAGAVFLPAAGCRTGMSVNYVGTHGLYWSSTHYNSGNAYFLYFASKFLEANHNDNRNCGFAVRLVR